MGGDGCSAVWEGARTRVIPSVTDDFNHEKLDPIPCPAPLTLCFLIYLTMLGRLTSDETPRVRGQC